MPIHFNHLRMLRDKAMLVAFRFGEDCKIHFSYTIKEPIFSGHRQGWHKVKYKKRKERVRNSIFAKNLGDQVKLKS